MKKEEKKKKKSPFSAGHPMFLDAALGLKSGCWHLANGGFRG